VQGYQDKEEYEALLEWYWEGKFCTRSARR